MNLTIPVPTRYFLHTALIHFTHDTFGCLPSPLNQYNFVRSYQIIWTTKFSNPSLYQHRGKTEKLISSTEVNFIYITGSRIKLVSWSSGCPLLHISKQRSPRDCDRQIELSEFSVSCYIQARSVAQSLYNSW